MGDSVSTFYCTRYIGKITIVTGRPTVDGWFVPIEQWSSLVVGRDAFAEKADAVADAEKRVRAKIASLQKQIKKLEKLNIKAPEKDNSQ